MDPELTVASLFLFAGDPVLHWPSLGLSGHGVVLNRFSQIARAIPGTFTPIAIGP